MSAGVKSCQPPQTGFEEMDVVNFLISDKQERWWGCGVVVLDELDKLMELIASCDETSFAGDWRTP